MHILVVSQYFHPEEFPINHVCEMLAQRVESVTVLTGQPNYPAGSVYEGYRATGYGWERVGDVQVLRVPVAPRGRGGAIRLAKNYLSFIASATLLGAWGLRRRKFDVVLVYAPSPLLQALPAILLKWIKRAPLVVWVQDLWPESLSATGFVKHSAVLRCVESCVRFIYSCTDLILVQSEEFIESVRKLASGREIRVHYNSVAPSLLIGNDAAQTFESTRIEAMSADTFNVVFAGNIGKAQGLDVVLKAAARLMNRPDIRIFLVGGGSDEKRLMEKARAEGLTNLFFLGRFKYSEMPGIFSRASALLAVLKRDPILTQTIPSKLPVYLATGKPVIASMDGAGARVVKASGGGLACSAEDSEALVDSILALADMDSKMLDEMGACGRRFYEARFEAGHLANELVQHFSDVRPIRP